MKVVVILPTYNEKENIGLMIDALEGIFKDIPHDMNILVVDDNSPDGTADVVRQKMEKFSRVDLLLGEKKGLGAAYIRGMKYAMGHMNADAVMEMDADFSHKPEDVPRLIEALVNGADFAIGSRYVEGGKIPADWGLSRRMVSKYGNLVARFIAGIYRVRDCTAGFRAIKASLLDRISLDSLNVQGYAFQVALLHKAVIHGATIKEVPVEFVNRILGESKLGFSDIMEFFKNALWIRLDSSKTFMKFCVVGFLGVFVNLGLFTLLINWNMNKFIASPVAIEASIIFNFFLNNKWTFWNRNRKENSYIKGLKFNLVSIAALCVSYSTFVILSLAFPKVLPQIHQAIGIIPATLLNYFLNSYWTFQKTKEEA